MAIRAVLFDATGTLMHLAEPVGVTYASFARDYGVDLPHSRIDDAFRRILARSPACVFPDCTARAEVVERERAWWRQVVRGTFLATDNTARFENFDAFFASVFDHFAGADAWRLAAGARTCLAELASQGIRMGIVSNFDHRLPHLLQALEIAQYFEVARLPIDVSAAKPDPALFRAALEALDLPPNEVVHVGDDEERDLEPARALGLSAIDVSELEELAALPARLRTLATLALPRSIARRSPDPSRWMPGPMELETAMSQTKDETTAVAFFRDRFALDESSLGEALDTALERNVDRADLYFEYTTADSVVLEESIVKSGDRHVSQGVGVRAITGERQGYAHSDDITLDSMQLAASTARAISDASGASAPVAVGAAVPTRDLYSVASAPTEAPVRSKVDLVGEMDAYARSLDPRVKQVMASVLTQHKHILVADSDGTLVGDIQPLVRLNAQVVVADATGQHREVGYHGMGGRYEFERLLAEDAWKPLVEESVRVALVNLEAVPCPAGTMDVVLGAGWPGILLHEAIGHGLEGDFNRKGTSAFADRMGQRVASEGVTVVDDGTLPGRRGSINVDDEGTPSRRNVLIENGVLVGYMQDRLNAQLMGTEPTGNGRRESYAEIPMPRMTNTFMLAGEEAPEDIIRSVDSGIYAVSFGGGQVDITSGKFVFSVSEAYRIENGVVGEPLKGATLIGNGPDVLTRVRRIGHDLELDDGVGTCGKDGQSVPVGVGLPTIRLDALTVGGTES